MYIAACLLDLSLRWPHQTWNAAKETSKVLFLFNRCHISFKTLETDSQEVFFFPFLRLQINVACVLSVFYKSTGRKRNTEMMLFIKDVLLGACECVTRAWLLSI